MTTRQVLLCGGPADGRWTTVYDGQYTVAVAMPSKPIRIADSGGLDEMLIETYEYQIERMGLLGTELWIGVNRYNDPHYQKAIARAVLQRDVAEKLGFTR